MKKQMFLTVNTMAFLVLLVGVAESRLVPDTNQTACYDQQKKIAVCPAPGDPFYGQDASYTIDPPSYTKLATGGVSLAPTALPGDGWVMTRDNATGLVWEMKTDDGSIHDKDGC